MALLAADYTQYSLPSYIGMMADINPSTKDTGIAQGTIPVGRGVIQGSTDAGVLLAAASGTFLGVARRSDGLASDASVLGYVTTDTLSVVRAGRIHVENTVDVAKNALAYCITAVGANQGKFTNVSTGNLLAGKFQSTALAGATVILAVS